MSPVGAATRWLAELIDALADVAGSPAPAEVRAELAVLSDLTAPVPAGLAATSLWVAGGFQRDIAARELVGLAEAVRHDIAGGVHARPTTEFLASVDAALVSAGPPTAAAAAAPAGQVLPSSAVEGVLRACAVSDERITDSAQGSILATDLARIVAVMTSWLAAARFLPRPMWPVAFLLRTAARIGYELVRDITHRRRRVVIAFGLLLVVVGVVAALVGSGLVGGLGVVAALVGLVIVGVPGWRRLPGGLAVAAAGALVLVAAAGAIPVLHDPAVRLVGRRRRALPRRPSVGVGAGVPRPGGTGRLVARRGGARTPRSAPGAAAASAQETSDQLSDPVGSWRQVSGRPDASGTIRPTSACSQMLPWRGRVGAELGASVAHRPPAPEDSSGAQ